MTITEHTTIAEIAAGVPSSVRVFQRHGIDFCCGGKQPLRTACEAHHVPVAEVVSAIETSAATRSDDVDWTREPLHALIDHIVATYHEPLREELPRLEAMAARVARVHGSKAPSLTRLAALVTALSADLRAHMAKEEIVLFPAIRGIERGPDRPAVSLAVPLLVLEDEHDRAGAMLADLRATADGYVPPAWACATFRALYQGLSELESTMHIHVHLENNVLFPRALRLAAV
jgi:regulator of cell morphogenesis and NO signaling